MNDNITEINKDTFWALIQEAKDTQQSYYQQIRGISDRLCREHGLSVIMAGESAKAISYVEWLRQSKGQPTFRSMLEADLRTAIQDANDLGHFFLIMEHMGYEVHHGDRLGFRLRGQERFQYPGRRDPLFTEDGIRVAIQGNLEQIEAGLSCLRGRRISRTGSIPDTAVFSPSMSIISICWARSKSGSIRPA